jgi:uncharacterized protein
VYTKNKDQILVNLYAEGEAKLKMDDGTQIKLIQKTEYPWEGGILITVETNQTSTFSLNLRVPGWALGRPVPSDLYNLKDSILPPISLSINGEKANNIPSTDGYIHLNRKWQSGDIVKLELPMPIQRVYANEKIEADKGMVTLMRGPLVYCVEAVDQPGVDLTHLILPKNSELKTQHNAKLLGGVTILEGEALIDGKKPFKLTAIPYYAWQNRTKGAMNVWIHETASPTN